MTQFWSRLAAIAASILLAWGTPAQADKVLRVVPSADLRVLDPHTNTATITMVYALMVYDTLFAWNSKLEPKPQMVDHYEVSADRLIYSFTLRPGLKFHDGQLVRTRDVIASLKRWMVRDGLGQTLATFTEDMKAIDDDTFELHLKRPFPFVETALAVSTGSAPAILREQDALTDPYKSITTTIGSGPFKFVNSEWVPGAKAVFEKNRDYVPRSEPPDGNAGGKVVKVDRVEWLVLPDAFTKATAIQRGEVDLVEALPNDQIPLVEHASDIVLDRTASLAAVGYIRPNQLFPPFDNPKARQALALAVDQEEYLSAAFGDERWWRPCYSYFICGSSNETAVGSEAYQKPDIARAKTLLAEAGYKGEKVVVINTHEIAGIGAIGDVTANNLRKLGINVQVDESDWGTMVTRRTRKDPPSQGGWNIFHTTSGGAGTYSPITNFAIDSSCDRKNWFGWPCDEETQRRRAAYMDATDDVTRRAALEALHRQLWQSFPTILVGQYVTPYAARKNIHGILHSIPIVYWNIEKD